MKATRSGVAIGLALALLVPVTAVGQEASEAALEIHDRIGDLDAGEGAFPDLKLLDVEADDEQLEATFHFAGKVPREVESAVTIVLHVDRDGDGVQDATIESSSADSWAVSLVEAANGEATAIDGLWVLNDTIKTRVPSALLGSPETLRFYGSVQIDGAGASDRAPDGESEWLALGDSAPPILFTASDLVAAGLADVSPESVWEGFAQTGCVKPGDKQDRLIECAVLLSSTWRGLQHRTGEAGLVSQEGFNSVLPAYQWAARTLGSEGKRYLDDALLSLDDVPLDWQRESPSGLKSSKAALKARKAKPDALRQQLEAAWADTLVPVLDGDDWAFEQGIRSSGPAGGPFFLDDNRSQPRDLTLIKSCQEAVDKVRKAGVNPGLAPAECGAAAAQVWLMYEATGDSRYLNVVRGLKSLVLAPHVTKQCGNASKLFDQMLRHEAGIKPLSNGLGECR